MKVGISFNFFWLVVGLAHGWVVLWFCVQLITADMRGTILSTNHVPEVFALLAFYLIARGRHAWSLLVPPLLVTVFWMVTC